MSEETKYKLERNPEFGFLQVKPTPTSDEITEFYADEFYSTQYKMLNDSELKIQLEDKQFHDAHREDMCETITQLTGRALKGMSVLDIGCGWAQTLLYFKEKGMDCFGFDPAQEAVAYAVKNGVNAVHAGMDKMDVFGGRRFDVVTLLNVLEHLADPVGVLKEIKTTVLKPGGVIIIDVPNEFNHFQICGKSVHKLNEWWVAPPGHLNYFNKDTLTNLLRGTGYNVLHFEASFPMELFLLFGMNYVEDRALGKKCHEHRKAFELNLTKYGYRKVLREFYQMLAEQNLGRQIIIYAGSERK